MASSLLKLLSRGSGCRCLLARQRVFQPSCFITTSKKNKDSVTEMPDASSSVLPRRPIEAVSPPEGPNTAGGRPEVHETVTGLGEKEENWISFGYSLTDRDTDEWVHHSILFFSVTIALVGTAFYMMYAPDYRMREWAQREAYLELARREAAGLPLVDPNLIDPSKIELPTDEELGDTEIII